jgi:glucose dehydrogenase
LVTFTLNGIRERPASLGDRAPPGCEQSLGIGAAMEERFHAFDAETGKLLWEFQMGAGGYTNPASFEVDGRQYVVIAAGGGGKPETRPGNAYYCFALPRPASGDR